MLRKMRLLVAALWVIVLAESSGQAEVAPAAAFLRDRIDYSHNIFWVYSDSAMPENHFVALAYMPAPEGPQRPIITVDMACTAVPHSGAECIRSEVRQGEAGACLQHGYMLPGDVAPRLNWGDVQGAGCDLRGARYLTFYARGERGGELVEFFIGGIGRDPYTDTVATPFPDIPRVSTGLVALSTRWRRFSLELPAGVPQNGIINGFGWWQKARPDGPSIVFIDTISYDKPRAREPHFPPSFVVEARKQAFDFDTVQRCFAHTYDVALTIIALLALEDIRRARLLADALVYAQGNDPDGGWIANGLRNCYSAGDLALPPGWRPTGTDHAVRLAGFWEPTMQTWYQDRYANAVYTGNVAWAGIALLHTHRATGEGSYVETARRLGRWVLDHAWSASGFSGGTEYWANAASRLGWVSTEHNIDCAVFYKLLADTDPQTAVTWSEAAAHAQKFVADMWNEQDGHFWTGLTPEGKLNRTFVPVDVQAWAMLAFREHRYSCALDWAIKNCTLAPPESPYAGFAFRDVKALPRGHPARGMWPEGTAQMVCALREAKRETEANFYLRELAKLQADLLAESKQGIVAALTDGLEAMPPEGERRFQYFRRQHLGATAWFIFAEMGINPYWVTATGGE